MERRDFIKNCSIACVGGISLLLESCGAVYYASSTAETNKIRINKSEFTDAKNNERKFIIVKNEKLQFPICIYLKEQKYTAVYMQCSHQGCELHPNKTSLVCPCHGSEFSIEGKVLSAPADKDLKQFKVITDNETIFIEL